MKKNNSVEYYRIANGKYNEEGQLVILNGLTGYNLERENTKNGLGKAMPIEKFIQVFEKATTKPDHIKISKISSKNNPGTNAYKVTYKDKKENETMVIKIGKEVSKNNPEIVTRFDNMRAANITYRNTTNAKKVAKKAKGFSIKVAQVAGCAFIGTALAWAFMTGLEKEAEYQNQKTQEYLEKYNIQRQEEIDEKCKIEYNYNNDLDCLARQEGYANYEEKIKHEAEMSYEDENENTRSRTR